MKWMYSDDKRKYVQNPMYSGMRDGDDSDDGVDNSEDFVTEEDVVDNDVVNKDDHLDTGHSF